MTARRRSRAVPPPFKPSTLAIAAPAPSASSVASASPTGSPTSLAEAHAPASLEDRELLAMPREELVAVNVDVDAAALLVLGTVPALRAHRAALVALVGEAMVAPLDRLEEYARATLQAQAALRSAETPVDVEVLAREALEVRGVLVRTVQALVARKLVPASALSGLRGGRGYLQRSFDVAQLSALLAGSWETVGPRVGLTLDELRHAEGVATALAMAAGLRRRAVRGEAAELRQRAFTRLARTYDHARRLIAFLRWNEGDADRIAPSFLGRAKGRRRLGARPTASDSTTSETPSGDTP